MKTTLELPDELYREIKLKAVREDRTIKDVTTDLLRRGLAAPEGASSGHRVSFPLVECSAPKDGLTPDELQDILLAAEVETLIV